MSGKRVKAASGFVISILLEREAVGRDGSVMLSEEIFRLHIWSVQCCQLRNSMEGALNLPESTLSEGALSTPISEGDEVRLLLDSCISNI
jgi:hypothetical protein